VVAVAALLLLACPPAVEKPDTNPSGDSTDCVETVKSDSSVVETSETVDTTHTETGSPDPGCDTGVDWYADRDGDGHGDPSAPTTCDDPAGAVADATDCDDAHPHVWEGAPELCSSGRDEDCDGFGGRVEITATDPWSATQPSDGRVWGFASDVALPGDMNGDGVDDLAIASYGYPMSEERWIGAVLVYPGPLAGVGHVVPEGIGGVLSMGSNTWAERLSGAGDTNGDGYADLLVQTYDPSYKVFLQRGPLPSGTVEISESGTTWEVPAMSEVFIEGAGDVNGDGLDDMLVNDTSAGGMMRQGAVYVLLGPGPESGALVADTTLAVSETEHLWGITPLGDLDGDGTSDFGTCDYTLAGYLVLDHAPGTFHPADVGVTVYQDLSGTWHHPMNVNAVGDVNGDGYVDAGFSEQGGNYLSVIFGSFASPALLDQTVDWDVRYLSENEGVDTFVNLSQPLGDWDGDGYGDLAIGNQYFVDEEDRADPDCFSWGINFCYRGAVFLVAGPQEAGWYDLETQADRVTGPDEGVGFPWTLDGGSDVDADGFPDLVLGNDPRNSAYVLFGGGDW